MAQAVVIERTGGPEVLTLAETDPVAGAGQLLVDVAAAGVNFIDTYQRSGVYTLPLPQTLGLEGAGTVAAVGEGVDGFSVGDRVAWASGLGSYATRAAIPASSAVHVPEGVDLETAAAVMLQGLTAHYLVNSTYPVADGETVLLHAGAGGVGLLLIQLAKRRGARVIATASTQAKRELAAGAGADEVIDYPGFDERAREFTDGDGVHVVYDGVGKSTFDASLRSLRRRGYLVLFGGASGQVPPFDLQRLNSAGSLFVTRPTLADHVADPAELRWRSEELFEAIQGGVSVRIGAKFPLAEAARAHAALEGRETTGKVLLTP